MSIAARLRATTWTDFCAFAFTVFFLAQLASIAAPPAAAAHWKLGGTALALLLLAAKDLAHAPCAWARVKRIRDRRGPWRDYPLALLPPELVGMVKLDRLMWAGMFQRLLRRQPPAGPEGVALSYFERGAYGSARAVIFVAMLLELPVHTMLINLWISDPAKLIVIHSVGAVAALWTLAWVLGDRWHLGAGRHVLTEDALHLQVGMRSQGMLPLAAVERMERVDLLLPAWRRKHGVAEHETIVVTPFDKPNCMLILKDDADVGILHWQVQRRLPRYVFLYLDRPELLGARLPARQARVTA